MESLIEYAPYWLMYWMFAVIGLWCWQKMFYLIIKQSDAQRLMTLLGVVLLFTPAPIAKGATHFAPAIFVLILDALSGIALADSNALIWLIAACCLAAFYMLIHRILSHLGTKTE